MFNHNYPPPSDVFLCNPSFSDTVHKMSLVRYECTTKSGELMIERVSDGIWVILNDWLMPDGFLKPRKFIGSKLYSDYTLLDCIDTLFSECGLNFAGILETRLELR